MIEATPLLRAKLTMPPPRRDVLRRERLHRRLAAGLDEGAVTTVLAGPGCGKSTVVAEVLRERDADVVWLQLDRGDRDPWVLCRYLLAGLQAHVPELGEHSAGLLEAVRGKGGPVETLADIMIRDLESSLSGRVHVVLDGIDTLVDADECTRLLTRMFAYLPATVHAIAIGRSMPDLGLGGRLADGSALVIHPSELAFDRDETRALLNDVFGLELDGRALEEVHARTRGWVTALQLLRRTALLKAGQSLPRDAFRGDEREMYDYFSEEVFAAQPAEVRELLLAAAPLDVVDPELLSAVLDGAGAERSLVDLERRGLFVTAVEGGGFQFDPLFREFLSRKLLAERGANGVQAIRRRFGLELAARREPIRALRHLVAADALEEIEHVLAEQGRRSLDRGGLREVEGAARLLLERGRQAAVADELLGETRRLAGDYMAAAGHFERAIPRLEGSRRAAALQGLAFSFFKIGELDRAARAAADALAEADESDPTLVARILNTGAIVRYLRGDHEAAIDSWREALARARLGNDEHLPLMIAHNLGLPYAVSGDLQRASECFGILTRRENRRLGPEEAAAHLNLARIATLRGRFDEAAARLDDAREIATRLHLEAVTGDILEAEGNLMRETARYNDAAARYAEARELFTALGMQEVLDNLAEEEAILDAIRGRHEAARRRTEELVRAARADGAPDRVASTLLAHGEVLVRIGDGGAPDVLADAAEAFRRSKRAFQECAAKLWLALARRRAGDSRADSTAEEAIRIADRFGYEATVARVAALDDAAAAWFSSLSSGKQFDAGTASKTLDADRADLTIRLLGAFEVFRDPRKRIPRSAWKLRKAVHLFCFLAASRNRRATKDRLVDAVWGNASAAVVKKNFHPTVSCVRRALNHGWQVPKNFIVFEAGGYQLNDDYRYDLDTVAFEAALLQARELAATDPEAAVAAYEAGLALYRGPLLEELDDPWLQPLRAHFEEVFHAALGEAATACRDLGDDERAAGYLRQRIDRDPVDEEASTELMETLARLHRRADVEREFRRLEKALKKELSVDPDPGTRRVFLRCMARQGPTRA